MYSKEKIVNGALNFAEREIIPLMADDKPVQVIAMTAAKYLRANARLTDSIFRNNKILAVLNYDRESGGYEIDTLLDAFRDSVQACGGFTVKIPIPGLFGAGATKSVTLAAEDVDKLRKYIEEA